MAQNNRENPDSQTSPDTENTSGFGRRIFLAGSTAAAILALFGISAPARAQTPTPCSDDPTCQDLLMDKYRSPIEFAAEELKLMQKTQEKLYEFFLNPSFLRHINATGKKKVVDEALKLAIRHPGELHYRDPERTKERGEELPGIILITPRPYAKHIPNGFFIKIERSQITEIRLPGERSIELNANGWRDWKGMRSMRSVIAEITQVLSDHGNDLKELTTRELIDVDYYLFRLPHRLRELVELRNQGTALEPEENISSHPAYQEFTSKLANHAKSYSEMKDNSDLTMWIRIDRQEQDHPGFIEVWDNPPGQSPIMYFGHEGYIADVKTTATFEFVPDKSSDYDSAIANRQKEAQKKTP